VYKYVTQHSLNGKNVVRNNTIARVISLLNKSGLPFGLSTMLTCDLSMTKHVNKKSYVLQYSTENIKIIKNECNVKRRKKFGDISSSYGGD
jgi:hypothetical protein